MSAPAAPPISAVVMAAGKGTRLQSDTPKVLHELFGKPLLAWVLQALGEIDAPLAATWVIVGHRRQQVVERLSALASDWPQLRMQPAVVQEPQLGTGHAMQQVKAQVQKPIAGSVLVLSGDVPLLTPASIDRLIEAHRASGAALSLLVADLDQPTGYGRVVMREGGEGSRQVEKIVEEKDASPAEKLLRTVNTGIYCLDWERVSPLLDRLSSDNAQGEFYLTDVVGLAVAEGLGVCAVPLDDPLEMCGINHRLDLSVCHEILHQRAVARLMNAGVSILHPASCLISPEVRVGTDTTILPGCYLSGDVRIGRGCTIGPHTTMMGPVTVGDQSGVVHSVVSQAEIGANTSVGPFAHLRQQAVLADRVRVGNFVEVKNTRIAADSNAAHLAYLGDATLGSRVNIGAGTIIANYDPIRGQKHHTTLADGVKVGCNSVLVSPVEIAEDACVAAGSVITRDVAADALAIARGKQQELPGWVSRTKKAADKP